MSVDPPTDRRVSAGRVLVPVGFLLALLAFVFLPAAGVSCGAGATGMTRICYPGWRVVSGVPDVSAGGNVSAAPELFADVQHAATLGAGVRVLGALTALVLLAGAASAVPADPFRRGVAGLVAAGAGVVLLVVTAALAASGGGNAYVYVDASRISWLGVGDGPGMSGGFWLATALILVAAGTALAVLHDARLTRTGDRLRAPGPD